MTLPELEAYVGKKVIKRWRRKTGKLDAFAAIFRVCESQNDFEVLFQVYTRPPEKPHD